MARNKLAHHRFEKMSAKWLQVAAQAERDPEPDVAVAGALPRFEGHHLLVFDGKVLAQTWF